MSELTACPITWEIRPVSEDTYRKLSFKAPARVIYTDFGNTPSTKLSLACTQNQGLLVQKDHTAQINGRLVIEINF